MSCLKKQFAVLHNFTQQLIFYDIISIIKNILGESCKNINTTLGGRHTIIADVTGGEGPGGGVTGGGTFIQNNHYPPGPPPGENDTSLCLFDCERRSHPLENFQRYGRR